MSCMLCFAEKETRHINIYPFGSEGLDVCHACEMEIVEFARELRQKKMDYTRVMRIIDYSRKG